MKKPMIISAAVFILVALATVLTFTTTIGGSFLLWSARTFVFPIFHAQLSYESAQFSPLNSLTIHNLKVIWQTSDQSLDLSVERIQAKYGLQIAPFGGSIEELTVEKPRFQANLDIETKEKEKKPTELNSLLDWLKSTHSKFEAKKIHLSDLEGELTLQRDDQTVHAQIRNFNFDGDSELRERHFEFNTKLNFGETKPLLIQATHSSGTFETELSGSLNLSVRLFFDSVWKINASTGSSHISIKNSKADRVNENEHTVTQIKSIQMTLGSMIKLTPDSFCSQPEAQDFRIRAELDASPLEVFNQSHIPTLKVSAHKWNLEASKNATSPIAGHIGVAGLFINGSGVGALVPVNTNWNFAIAKGCQSLSLAGELGVFDQQIVNTNATLQISNASGSHDFDVTANGRLDIPARVARVLKSVPWQRFGLWSGHWSLQGHSQNRERSGVLHLKLNQNFAFGRAANAVSIGQMALDLKANAADHIEGTMSFSRVRLNPAREPIPLDVQLDLVSALLRGSSDTKGQLIGIANNKTFMTNDIDIHSGEIRTQTHLSAEPLTRHFIEPELARKVGALDLAVQVSGHLEKALHVEGELSRTADPNVLPFRIDGNTRFALDIPDIQIPKKLNLKVTLPTLHVPDQVIWGQQTIAVDFAPITHSDDFSISAKFLKNELTLFAKKAAPLKMAGLEGDLVLRLDSRPLPQLQTLDLSLASGAAHVTSHSSRDQSGRSTLEAKVGIQIPSSWPEFSFGSLSGASTLSLIASQQRNQLVTFDGQLEFRKLSVAVGPFKLIGINGEVPYSEVLRIHDNSIAFATISELNPFEFAEFENFQPITQRFKPLSIDKISFYKKTYGPYESYASIQQNFIENRGIHFEIPGGYIVGDMILDLNPDSRSLGLLTRMSGIRLSELVPDELSRGVKFSSDPMSGRAGLVLSFNKKEVNGRFDITQIGSSQLISMINYVDPDYENDKLAAARTGLTIAYPTMVLGKLQNGYMDLNMSLGGLAPAHYGVPSIPVAALVVSAFDRFGVK